VPTDTVKYELDKATGHLKIDRPQKYSSVCPTLYGLLPQTICGDRVADACRQRTGRMDIVGDGDPLDICVLSERPISHGDILLRAVPIGGLRMIDHNQADDKIIGVLKDDPAYGDWTDIYQCPPSFIDRSREDYREQYAEIERLAAMITQDGSIARTTEPRHGRRSTDAPVEERAAEST
jgi:inorganic pyrophosphatase